MKMKASWMTEGAPWTMVGILHDQVVGILLVPNVSQVLTAKKVRVDSDDDSGRPPY